MLKRWFQKIINFFKNLIDKNPITLLANNPNFSLYDFIDEDDEYVLVNQENHPWFGFKVLQIGSAKQKNSNNKDWAVCFYNNKYEVINKKYISKFRDGFKKSFVYDRKT